MIIIRAIIFVNKGKGPYSLIKFAMRPMQTGSMIKSIAFILINTLGESINNVLETNMWVSMQNRSFQLADMSLQR